MITLSEYARINGKNQANVYRKYKKGDFKTAEKIGNVVLIDEDEPYSDKRLVNGRYVGYRENIRVGQARRRERILSEGQGMSKGQKVKVEKSRPNGQG